MYGCPWKLLLLAAACVVSCQPPQQKEKGETLLTGAIILPGESSDLNIATATVQLLKGEKIVAETVSDEAGRFTFTGLPRGKFDLAITKGDLFEPYKYSEAFEGQFLDVDDFHNGRHFQEFELQRRSTTLSGRVVSADTQEGVKGATITTYPRTVRVLTDSTGAYRLESDRFEESTASYAIIFNHPEFEPDQIMLPDLVLAEENDVATVALKPHRLDEGVEDGQVYYGADESEDKVTQGEK